MVTSGMGYKLVYVHNGGLFSYNFSWTVPIKVVEYFPRQEVFRPNNCGPLTAFVDMILLDQFLISEGINVDDKNKFQVWEVEGELATSKDLYAEGHICYFPHLPRGTIHFDSIILKRKIRDIN